MWYVLLFRMPFGLKSAGSTFARAVQIGFEPQLHRNMEAYMDDIVVKTKDKATLVQDLEETLRSVPPVSHPASFSGSLCRGMGLR